RRLGVLEPEPEHLGFTLRSGDGELHPPERIVLGRGSSQPREGVRVERQVSTTVAGDARGRVREPTEERRREDLPVVLEVVPGGAALVQIDEWAGIEVVRDGPVEHGSQLAAALVVVLATARGDD